MNKPTLLELMNICYTYRYEVRLYQYNLVQSSDLLFNYKTDAHTYRELVEQFQNTQVKYFNSYVDEEGLPVIRIVLENDTKDNF